MTLPIIEVENDCGLLYAYWLSEKTEDYFCEKYGPIVDGSYANGYEDGYKAAMEYIRGKTFD